MKHHQPFSEYIANTLADALATMSMFSAVTILTISILFFQTPHSPLEWIQYIIQCFFQGVALPVLAFVAKIEGRKQERLLKETHDTVMREMKEIKALLGKVDEIEAEEERIEAELDASKN